MEIWCGRPAGAIVAGRGMWYNKAEIFGPREYRGRCLHRSAIRQAADGPMASIGPYMCDVA